MAFLDKPFSGEVLLRAVHGALQSLREAMAIAWTLWHPAVTGAVAETCSAKQVKGVMAAGDSRLSEEESAAIERGLDWRMPDGRPQRQSGPGGTTVAGRGQGDGWSQCSTTGISAL